MKTHLFIVFFLLFFPLAAAAQTAPSENPHNLPDGIYAEVTTPRGVIVSELFYKKTPLTCTSFIGLAEGTLGPEPRGPFYANSGFFRVEPGFVAQGGGRNPAGRGGAGYSYPDEIVPGLRHTGVGVMQMANGGVDTNGSQWCFMLGPAQRLNYNHTIFGYVVRGQDVLLKVERNDTYSVKILRLGADARAFKADEASFNALRQKAPAYQGERVQGPNAYFHDPDGILPSPPADRARGNDFNRKLGQFQRFTGGRIIGRLYAKTPDDAQGEKLKLWLENLAKQFNVADKGALVVYFKDANKWHLRVAPQSAADFLAGPRKEDGTKAPAPAKTLEQATQDFIDKCMAEVPSLITIAEKAAFGPAATQPFTDAQKFKFQVDAILDNLIFHLEPAAGKRLD